MGSYSSATLNTKDHHTCALLRVLVVARLQHELLAPPTVERAEEVQGLFLLLVLESALCCHSYSEFTTSNFITEQKENLSDVT